MVSAEGDGKAAERDESSELSSDVGSDSENNSNGDDDDGNGDSDDDGQRGVEWLATTRTKRSTAGNRMKSLLANEEPAGADDSDLELLFAEDEDDAGFTDVEKDDAGSDVHMDSSSDEEDQDGGGVGANGDELEGEKELERQAREKRTAARKRKAQDAIPLKFRKKKKVRIEPPAAGSTSPMSTTTTTTPMTAAPQSRPRKKSERLSWLPSVADLPTRASERQTTRMSKEQLHEKMRRDDIRRRKQAEQQEKKAKMLEALKKPPMTQEERLAEAALVEKRNSKSLNRWEEAEKQREEERLRKIAALNNRKLDGPVVTFWSGIQELEEGQQKHVGKMVAMEEKVPRKKRQSAAAAVAARQEIEATKTATSPALSVDGDAVSHAAGNATSKVDGTAAQSVSKSMEAASFGDVLPEVPSVSAPALPPLPSQASAPPSGALLQLPSMVPPLASVAPPPIPPAPNANLSPSGVLAAPMLAPRFEAVPPMMAGGHVPALGMSASNTASAFLAHPNASHVPSPLSLPPSTPDTPAPIPASTLAASNAKTNTAVPPPTTPPLPSTLTALQPTQPRAASRAPDTPREEPSSGGKVTRSCIILQNFNENAIKDPQVQTQILFGRKMSKLARPAHPPFCAITHHPAKYKDPKTGLPYANTYAYREIQRLQRGDYKWSRLIGAWVGSATYAARGVPERFLDPSKPRTTTPATTTSGVVLALKEEFAERKEPAQVQKIAIESDANQKGLDVSQEQH